MGDTTPAGATKPSAGSPRTWVRATLDRVPTKWAGAIGIGLFLAATAAFGGLNEVPAPPGPPEVGIGDQVLTSNLDITVEEVFIADRIVSGAPADPDSGERVLAVRLSVTNLHPEYRLAARSAGFGGARRAEDPDIPPDVSRPGESSGGSLFLQPDLAEDVILSWAVSAADYEAGDEVRIALPDPQLVAPKFLLPRWENAGVAAYIVASLEDHGEGDPW